MRPASRRAERGPEGTARIEPFVFWFKEMMVGFFDVAVDAGVDKKKYFVR